MAATKKEKIEELLQQGNRPIDIATRFGCTPSYVCKLGKAAGIEQKFKRGPKPLNTQDAINKLHARIGRRLFEYRQIIHGLSLAEMSEKLKMSTTRVQLAENGMCRLELHEVQSISKLLEIPMKDLCDDEEKDAITWKN